MLEQQKTFFGKTPMLTTRQPVLRRFWYATEKLASLETARSPSR